MKLSIDASGDMLYLSFREGPERQHKQIGPNIILGYTEDGELSSILVFTLSSLLGGQKLQDLDLDLAPPRENLHIEVDEASLRRVREKLAEYLPEDKTRS